MYSWKPYLCAFTFIQVVRLSRPGSGMKPSSANCEFVLSWCMEQNECMTDNPARCWLFPVAPLKSHRLVPHKQMHTIHNFALKARDLFNQETLSLKLLGPSTTGKHLPAPLAGTCIIFWQASASRSVSICVSQRQTNVLPYPPSSTYVHRSIKVWGKCLVTFCLKTY